MKRLLSSSLALSLLLGTSLASARDPFALPPLAGVPVPGRSFAGITDASAVSLNPANLAFLPSWELRATWVRTGQGSPIPNRGWSFDIATPLFFDFSAGLRLDLVRPPSGARIDVNYRIITGALAYNLSDSASIGVNLSKTYADVPALQDIWGSTVALSLRPSAYVGVSAGIRNWNRDQSTSGLLWDRSFDGGLTLRPTGKRAFELGLDMAYVDRSESWFPKATLGIDVPKLGRLRGDIALDEPFNDQRAYVASAGLEINAGALQASGGGVFGSWPGADGAGFYAGLAVRGYREPGLPSRKRFAKLRVEKTPGARAHVRLLRALWRVADDPDVLGVGLQLKAEPASSFAYAEELGDAIRMLRARGKKVFCQIEDGAGRALYVCSQADRIVMNPAGGFRVSGLRSQYMYFGEALSKLGVRTDFVRIGAHKSAAEQFTERGPSSTADADHREMLKELERTWIEHIGGGRGISAPELRERIARGPFVAREAKAAGLIDGYAFDDEFDSVVSELVGERVPVVELSQLPTFAKRVPDEMGERDRIAVVYVDGDMIDGRSRDLPIISNRLVGSYTVAAALKEAREDARVKAVVLRVETPGGSSMAADVIWREVMLTAKAKPLVVSMGSMAASAGYYISSPGSVIFANRTTLTGSIGIFYGKADVDELLKKLGVNIVTYRSAPRADAESFYRPFTEDERQELGRKVKIFYDTFVDRVARGRKMTPDEVDAVARGKVWTGEQAVARKLVDHVGGLREALEQAQKMAHVPWDTPLLELPEQPTDLLSTALSLAGLAQAKSPTGESLDEVMFEARSSDAPSAGLPPILLRAARSMLPFVLFESDAPQARLEMEPELP